MSGRIEKRGFFRFALQALIEARTREAAHLVAKYEASRDGTPADRLAGRHISAGY